MVTDATVIPSQAITNTAHNSVDPTILSNVMVIPLIHDSEHRACPSTYQDEVNGPLEAAALYILLVGQTGGQIRLLRVLNFLDTLNVGWRRRVSRRVDASMGFGFGGTARPSRSEVLSKAEGFRRQVSVSPSLSSLYAGLIVASRISLAALGHK